MENYWQNLISDSSVRPEDLFLLLRDDFTATLSHLFDDEEDIPDFRLYFAKEARTLEEGTDRGYDVVAAGRSLTECEEIHIRDVADIPNFENSFMWMRDDVFIVIDFCGGEISPLQFISQSFIEEALRQLFIGGYANLKLAPMYDLFISTGILRFFYGFYHLDINFLQNLSAAFYEQNSTEGRILLPRYDVRLSRRTKAGLKVGFEEPVPFNVNHLRRIRKMVELSDKNLALVVNETGEVIGLTDQHAHPGEAEIRLLGHLHWTITFENKNSITYDNARYHILSSRRNRSEIHDYLAALDNSLAPAQVEKMEKVIGKLIRRKQGAILIIGSHEDVLSETTRLCGGHTGVAITPVKLDGDEDIIENFVRIDGALLMDTRCFCTCIGAILDGDADGHGRHARGSRFNSTVNYIRRRAVLGERFIGIVVSEDNSCDAVTPENIYHLQ